MEETQFLVDTVFDAIQDKKGRSIVSVDLRKIITAPSEFFVICTAGSPQQADAICESVEDNMRIKAQERPSAIVGRENGEWIAMDYGTVMVHIFLPEAREHYDLENLWDDAELYELPDLD